eukprot:GHVU01233423.1.p1 GENE.GHVU01233423.1~~GHVU01233423.1.p1  ORF type:complete len:113 (+),score=6.97 GHVU01233423.1:250-588(+)
MTDQRPRVGECAICLQPLVEQLGSLPCGHIFHDACVRRIPAAKRRCPTCRADYTVRNIRLAFIPTEKEPPTPPAPRWNRQFLPENRLTEIFKEVDRLVTTGAPGYVETKYGA